MKSKFDKTKPTTWRWSSRRELFKKHYIEPSFCYRRGYHVRGETETFSTVK